MGNHQIKVVIMDEASTFIRSLPQKVQEKITYNYLKIEQGIMDKELFKKLEGTDIWGFARCLTATAIGYSLFGTQRLTLLLSRLMA